MVLGTRCEDALCTWDKGKEEWTEVSWVGSVLDWLMRLGSLGAGPSNSGGWRESGCGIGS